MTSDSMSVALAVGGVAELTSFQPRCPCRAKLINLYLSLLPDMSMFLLKVLRRPLFVQDADPSLCRMHGKVDIPGSTCAMCHPLEET